MAEILEEQVRLLIWDKGAEPILTTEEIQLIINISEGVLERAVALGWAVKGGYFSQMIDITESGSIRMLNQLYKNCERQHAIWDKKAAGIETLVGLAAVRVAPVAFDILGEAVDWTDRISIFRPNEPVNVRMFPLKRMMAIL